MADRYPVIPIHQYASDGDDDLLYLFAAPAKILASWAGIPRKGWRVRMLYQRWVTKGRESQVRDFWDDAATYERNGKRFLLGPTALTLAATEPLDVNRDGIALKYVRPFALNSDEYTQLEVTAKKALDQILPRLSDEDEKYVREKARSQTFETDQYNRNHIVQSASQIAQLANDAKSFCQHFEIGSDERAELIESLEALCRPALIVDGQHRLLGAALSKHEIWLPVVLIPNATWLDQIYQFIVINDTAQRVQPDLLTDIFGNSLTPDEQLDVRNRLAKSRVDVEGRIAAVIAGTHPDSPFKGLVRLKLNASTKRREGYISELTIRQLLDGGRGGTPGWRTDDEFYLHYIKPTISDREEWEGWTSGAWQRYWFAFWDEVGKFYNEQVANKEVLWGDNQSNLTKAVTLRLMQELFIKKSIERARAVESLRNVLRGRFSDDEADQIVNEEVEKHALPSDLLEFRRQVREWFLSAGVPVRVFQKPWVKSLDDDAGISELRMELDKAFDLTTKGERYRAQNKAVFSVEDKDS